ncbi:MAG TPA: hypothetical protein VIS29_05260 [Streptomyces sp.]
MNGQPHPLDVPPAPRWIILPRDPPPLVAWLRARQAEDPNTYAPPLPPEPPPEEDR